MVQLNNKKIWIIITYNCKACQIVVDLVKNILTPIDYRDKVFLFNEIDIRYVPTKIIDKLEFKGYPIVAVTDNDNNILYQQVGTIGKTELTKILLQ